MKQDNIFCINYKLFYLDNRCFEGDDVQPLIVSNTGHTKRFKINYCSRPYSRFTEIQSNLRKKKLHRTNKGSNFFGGSFSN